MALIKCKECGKEMSANATACPNCGNPNTLTKEEKQVEIKKQETENNISIAISIIVIFVIIGLFFLGMSLWDSNDMDNKVINGVVDGINTITDSYIEHEQEKEKKKELENRIYDIFNIE